jgi:hypothetical protein
MQVRVELAGPFGQGVQLVGPHELTLASLTQVVPSQVWKLALHWKPQTPAGQTWVAFAGVAQSLAQQTSAMQKPDRHCVSRRHGSPRAKS